MKTNIFEQASRTNLQVPTSDVSTTSVHSLWTMPMESKTRASLTSTAIYLHSLLKNADIPDFLSASPKDDNLNQLSFDIVKHVIEVRQSETALRTAKAEKQSQAKLLREAIAVKKADQLLSGDVSDLEKRLAELEA